VSSRSEKSKWPRGPEGRLVKSWALVGERAQVDKVLTLHAPLECGDGTVYCCDGISKDACTV
jgi:hypothetical protein